jgi:hypothetical protein
MKTRLHLHLPQASDGLTTSSELLVVDEVLHFGILHWNNRKAILSTSLSSLIMCGSRLLLTVSTADRSVLHYAEVAHFHHSSHKSSEEL